MIIQNVMSKAWNKTNKHTGPAKRFFPREILFYPNLKIFVWRCHVGVTLRGTNMAARSSNIHALIYKTKNAVELKNVKKQVLAALTSHFNWKLGILITFLANQQRRIKITRVVNPPHLQILRIDREGIIDDVIMQETWRHLCKKHAKKMLLEL